MNNHPIAYLLSHSNNPFEAQQRTCLLSGLWIAHLGGVLIHKEPKDSIRRSIALYCVRSLPKHTWINSNNVFIGIEDINE